LEKLNLYGKEAAEKWPALSLMTFKLGKGIDQVLDANASNPNSKMSQYKNNSALSKRSKRNEDNEDET
jgi:hypothetical protein